MRFPNFRLDQQQIQNDFQQRIKPAVQRSFDGLMTRFKAPQLQTQEAPTNQNTQQLQQPSPQSEQPQEQVDQREMIPQQPTQMQQPTNQPNKFPLMVRDFGQKVIGKLGNNITSALQQKPQQPKNGFMGLRNIFKKPQ